MMVRIGIRIAAVALLLGVAGGRHPAVAASGPSDAERMVEAVTAVALPAAPNDEADLDRDGKVTLADLGRLALDLSTLAAAWRGDVNDDLRVDGEDLALLAARLLAAVGEGTDETRVRALVEASVTRFAPTGDPAVPPMGGPAEAGAPAPADASEDGAAPVPETEVAP